MFGGSAARMEQSATTNTHHRIHLNKHDERAFTG